MFRDLKKALECCQHRGYLGLCNCDDCPYRYRGRCDQVRKDALNYIVCLESAQPQWISVEERLPEDDLPENSDAKEIKVFVAIKGENGTTVRTQTRNRRTLFDTRGEPFFDWEWRYSSGKVTHWMPLPPSPKEEV